MLHKEQQLKISFVLGRRVWAGHMGLEILHLFQASTDYVAAAIYEARITSPVPVILWHSAWRAAPSAPCTHPHPHCSDLSTSLGPEVTPAFSCQAQP